MLTILYLSIYRFPMFTLALQVPLEHLSFQAILRCKENVEAKF